MMMNLANPQQVIQDEVTKRRSDNVKALEAKQQQLELESYRRSEAIEATRREQLRKQRRNERLLQEAAEAAEKQEQERTKNEKEAMERRRHQDLEEQRKRIEQAKTEERERIAARDKQLREQREAAALAKAEEEKRRLQLLEESAEERIKKSYDRILEKLNTTIDADRQMMDEDTAKRRRERQLCSDAATALSRVKAIETQLQRHRDVGRAKLHERAEKLEHRNLDEKFHILNSDESVEVVVNHGDGGGGGATGGPNKDLLFSPEKLRSILLIQQQGSAQGGGSNSSCGHNNTYYYKDSSHEREYDDDDHQNEQDELDAYDEEIDDLSRSKHQSKARQTKKVAENPKPDVDTTTNFYGTSVVSPNGVTAKRRELKPLGYETWQKQREAESELVSLSLEYQMRTGSS